MRFLLLLLLIPGLAISDQRFETEQGQCHFSYDPNDDDNEVYFANCVNTINTYDNGAGRLAYGTAIVDAPVVSIGIPRKVKLQGTAAVPRDGYITTETDCQMVTSNYNGDGTNNYTTYATNDWYLTIDTKGKGNSKKGAKYELTCSAAAQQ
jgi:hypothetical protein